MSLDTLRVLVDLRDMAIQKGRIAMRCRLSAIERGADTSDEETEGLLRGWHEKFEALEKEIDDDIRMLAEEHLIIEAATAVKGCGLLNVAKVVALTGGVADKKTVSQLWRFSGYGMGEYYVSDETGKIKAPVKGRQWDKNGGEDKKGAWVVVYPEQPPDTHVEFRPDIPIKDYGLPYNRRLKTACYLVGQSLMRVRGPYYGLYTASRAKYDRERPDWTDLHRHRAAMRRMMKMWLCHLWEVWRELEELPTRRAYVLDYLGHKDGHDRRMYGWE